MSKQTICLDFDGVVHLYESPWEEPWIIRDGPVPGVAGAIRGYLDAGFEVAIFSSRSSSNRGHAALMVWCEEHLGRELTTEISFPGVKPPALIYIDDRGFRFEGEFPTVDYIKGAKPWNK